MNISWVSACSTFLLYSVFLSVLFFLLDVFIETFLIFSESPTCIISLCFLASLIVCLHFLMASLYLFLSISPLFHFLYNSILYFSAERNPPSPTGIFLSSLYFEPILGQLLCFPCWAHLKTYFFPFFPDPSSLSQTSFWSDYLTQNLNNKCLKLVIIHSTSDTDWIFNKFKGLIGMKTKWDILNTSLWCWTNIVNGGWSVLLYTKSFWVIDLGLTSLS